LLFFKTAVHPALLQVSGWEEQLITAAVHFVKCASSVGARRDGFLNTLCRNNVRFAKGTGSNLEVSKLLKVRVRVCVRACV
jgi:hypothetical protein